jgi:ankyrin repeat protein
VRAQLLWYGKRVSAADKRYETHRLLQRLNSAYKAGDLTELQTVLGWPESFPNSLQPFELASGDWPLVTAINLSPLPFIRQLLDLGADPNFEALDGFPSLMVAIDANRTDRSEVITMLLHYGAQTTQRGINDWTPLHYAVARRNLDAVRLLIAVGADPHARTRIDDHSTPLEDAHAAGFAEAVASMQAS